MNMMMFRRYAARLGAVALCSAALCTTPILAQGGGGRMMQTPDQQVDALNTAVSLTPDQMPKVKAIYEADANKRTDLMSAQDPEMRAKMMAMRTDERAQIKALLTEEQKTKYDAMLATQRQRMGGRQGGGPPPQ